MAIYILHNDEWLQGRNKVKGGYYIEHFYTEYAESVEKPLPKKLYRKMLKVFMGLLIKEMVYRGRKIEIRGVADIRIIKDTKPKILKYWTRENGKRELVHTLTDGLYYFKMTPRAAKYNYSKMYKFKPTRANRHILRDAILANEAVALTVDSTNGYIK
jgi:hypothetical protein